MAQFLVTGFLPFLGEKINPSKLLAEELGQRKDWRSLILPVSYQKSFEVLNAAVLASKELKFLLMLGQAGGRRRIGLERNALNVAHAESLDEDGILAQERRIDPSAPMILQTELPILDWKNELRRDGYDVEVSHSAGTFVCNSIYFQALYNLGSQGPLRSKVLFVHVPHLPSQAKEAFGGHEGMDFEKQKLALEALVKKIENLN